MADQNQGGNTSFMLPPPPEDTRSTLLSNILAIAGFIIIIVVVIWGLVHLANLSRGWFSSFFGGTRASEITVTAPQTATSGQLFSISWTYSTTTTGTYAFLYPCANTLQFSMPNSAGVVTQVPCGAAFPIPENGNSLSLVPFLSGTSSLPMPVSILFLPNASGTPVQGGATIRVLAAEGAPSPAPTPNPVPTPTPTPSPAPTPVPSAGTVQTTPADLSVRIISVVPQAGGITTVSFSVANLGGTASGTYFFNASIPTANGYTYVSPTQASLSPGSSIVNTLRFTQLRPGGGLFSVTVDPAGSVRESNRANNTASQTISGGYEPVSPYPYNYYYNQYPYQYNPYPYTQYYPYAY